jgi:hypothetical protein
MQDVVGHQMHYRKQTRLEATEVGLPKRAYDFDAASVVEYVGLGLRNLFGITIIRAKSSCSHCQPSILRPLINNDPHFTMLLAKLLLLPVAVASSVTLYVSSVPAFSNSAVIPSPIPLAQIEYDADQSVGTLTSYTPPTGSYASDHLLRVGLSDPKTGSWRGIVTSAASFSDQYHKKIVVHVDETGEPFHVGFSTTAKSSGDEVEVEIVKRSPGPKPVLNKPIVLNAEGKLEGKEPEKSFLQKYV